ncbi:MAG TPA: RNA-binding domain-containing protein [Nitrososphaerales archaeon]|nr:RNA-binding domain-containing protein [Nitrososphaerales archaeon]
MKGLIQAVEVSYLAHPTEDPDRIEERVKSCLGIQAAPSVTRLEGHYGYPILMVKYHLTGEEAHGVVRQVAEKMSPESKRNLREDSSENIDEHSALYLRFDKQQIMRGKLVLGQADSVRIRIKPRLFLVKGKIEEFYMGVLGLNG